MLSRQRLAPRFLRFEPDFSRLRRFPWESTREHAHRMRTIVDRWRDREIGPDAAPSETLPPKPDGSLRLVTLNLAHGRNRIPHQALARRATVERHLALVADTVRSAGADLVALQEADGPSAWSGNFDHVALVARHAELTHFRGGHNPFRLGSLSLDSGTALLSRLPMDETYSHHFCSTWRCTKGFVVATVEVPEWGATKIDMVSLHLDFLAPRIRRRQIQELAEILGGRDRPRVVLGDLNCSWELEPRSMVLLSDKLGLRAHRPEDHAPTYPAHRPRFRLDWILVSQELDFHGYHTVATRLSDHLAVVADLRPRAGRAPAAPALG